MQLKIRASALTSAALCAALLSRVLTEAGLPKIIDHLHFLLVILVMFIFLINKNINNDAARINSALFALMSCIVLSTAINNAGLVNVALEFILLAEPILFFIILTGFVWSRSSVCKFQRIVFLLIIAHAIFAYFQFFAMGLRGDNVRGLFLSMGAGAHVAGAVAATAAIFCFRNPAIKSQSIRILSLILLSPIVVFTDSKQVLAVFLVSMFIFTLTKISNLRKTLTHLTLFMAIISTLIWLTDIVFPALLVWAKFEIIIEGLQQKLSVVSIIIYYYESIFNWLFGLGPGHTVGRLGFMLPDYREYIVPIGGTMSETTRAVWIAQQENYISNSSTGSSMFSLFFSWAGIWGDLGLVGLAVYSYLWFLVWRIVRSDPLSSFLFITIIVFGGTFSWLEEPGYMLFVMSILGLRRHDLTINKEQRKIAVADRMCSLKS